MSQVALGAIFAAATLAAFALVGLVLMMGDVNVNGAETQQLLDARDEIKQLSNMIKNKVHTDQSFDTQKTTPKSRVHFSDSLLLLLAVRM